MILIFAFLTVKKINSKGPKGGSRVLRACFSNFFQRKKKIRVSSDYDAILHQMITSGLCWIPVIMRHWGTLGQKDGDFSNYTRFFMTLIIICFY